jgi:hypothetical protein
MAEAAFDSLDFLYTPSQDVAADAAYFTEVLGGEPVFAVEGMGARVAGIRMTDGGPLVLLTDHLEAGPAIMVFRVRDLGAALDDMERRGWNRQRSFEIPHGPCCSFVTPTGQRIALYQLTRPDAAHHFDGRFDF